MVNKSKERGRIGRTFYKTYCDCRMLNEHNDIIQYDFVLDGYYNDKVKAQNAVSKLCPNASVMVVNITHTSFYASMPIDDFLKYADLIGEEVAEEN